MKYRVSDTDIINMDKVDFVEIDGSVIKFHIGSNVHQSVYNNDMESQCVLNNIINHFKSQDLRFINSELDIPIERKEVGFNMFWNLFDKRIDKSHTKTAFMNLTIKEMGLAVKGVRAYVESTPNKKYRKNPRTWLNAKSWGNELDEDKNKSNRYVKPDYVTDER